MALSHDTLVVGAPTQDFEALRKDVKDGAGAVYVFTRSDSVWSLQQKIVNADRRAADFFGWSVDIEGDTLDAGAPGQDFDAAGAPAFEAAGAAYLFTRSGSTWTGLRKIAAPEAERDAFDQLGWSVSVSGGTVAVGAPSDEAGVGDVWGHPGAVYVFNQSGGDWVLQQKVTPSGVRSVGDRFGLALDLDGDFLLVGAPGHDFDAVGAHEVAEAGAAHLFERSGAHWSESAKLCGGTRLASQGFGGAVALSGARAAISSTGWSEDPPNAIPAEMFAPVRGIWQKVQDLGDEGATPGRASDVLGAGLAISGNWVVLGAPGHDAAVDDDVGAVFVHRAVSSDFSQ